MLAYLKSSLPRTLEGMISSHIVVYLERAFFSSLVCRVNVYRTDRQKEIKISRNCFLLKRLPLFDRQLSFLNFQVLYKATAIFFPCRF